MYPLAYEIGFELEISFKKKKKKILILQGSYMMNVYIKTL